MTHRSPTDPRLVAATRYCAALAAACISGLALAQANAPRQVPTLAPMIETVAPAVVNIAVTASIRSEAAQTPQDELLRRFFDFEGPPGGDREVEGAGSGVIVDAANGYVLTNHHVIANAAHITVTLLE